MLTLPMKEGSGQAAGNTGAQRETGNRMIGWGALTSEAYIPVSGLPLIVMISLRVAGGSPRWQVAGTPPSVIRPLSSILSSVIQSVLHSVLNAALHSVLHSFLRDRFSPLSSVIDSAIHSAALCRDAVPTLPMAN